jgi:hypothetical protein
MFQKCGRGVSFYLFFFLNFFQFSGGKPPKHFAGALRRITNTPCTPQRGRVWVLVELFITNFFRKKSSSPPHAKSAFFF